MARGKSTEENIEEFINLSVRVPKSKHNEIKRVAKLRGMTPTTLTRMLLYEELKKTGTEG